MKPLIDQAIAIFTANGLQFIRMDKDCLRATFEATYASHEVFVETHDEFNTFGIYIYPPTKIPVKSMPRVMEYITRVNYGLRLGHFELDLDEGVLRYAHGVDIEGSRITPPMLLNALYFGLSVMDDYYPGLMRILFSGASPKKACEETRQGKHEGSMDMPEAGVPGRPMDRLRH